MASMYDGNKHYSILISSGLKSGQLKVHCRSYGTTKDDVEPVLEPGKSFGWDFKVPIMPIVDYTSYSCNFNWNDKKINLNVWNGFNGGTCGGGKTYWAVLEDGFYFRCVGGNWEKRFAWDGALHLGPSIDNAH